MRAAVLSIIAVALLFSSSFAGILGVFNRSGFNVDMEYDYQGQTYTYGLMAGGFKKWTNWPVPMYYVGQTGNHIGRYPLDLNAIYTIQQCMGNETVLGHLVSQKLNTQPVYTIFLLSGNVPLSACVPDSSGGIHGQYNFGLSSSGGGFVKSGKRIQGAFGYEKKTY